MRPEAKFHDGSRMTAHDVAFSLNLLKEKGHPIIIQLMRDVTGVEATDDATVVVRFAQGRGRDVPLFVATLPIFSRAYYAKRPFDETTHGDRRSGPAPTRSASSKPAASSNTIASRIGGAPSCRYRSDTNNFDVAPLRILSRSRRRLRRVSPAAAICSARSSPRASGRRATISRRSSDGRVKRTSCPTTRHPARRAGSSTRGARSSRTGRCARR